MIKRHYCFACYGRNLCIIHTHTHIYICIIYIYIYKIYHYLVIPAAAMNIIWSMTFWVEYIENNVLAGVANCLCAHERVILVFISHFFYLGNKYQDNPWVSTQAVCHDYTCITLFIAQHDELINYNKKVFSHWHHASLGLFTFWLLCHKSLCSTGDDVTIEYITHYGIW